MLSVKCTFKKLIVGISLLGSTASMANTADILVLYTPSAERTSQGRDMPARIAAYIEFANQSLRNSEVDLQFNLVGYERLDSGYDFPTFQNVRAFSRDRDVARKRAEYGADMVTLLNLRQEVREGFICGIAADVTKGNSANGQFLPYASSVAFNLTGIDCGLNTFIHEFGHNMGLGHGVRQSAPGGVFDWGRGYGVDNAFSTIMGYPQAYDTRNQLPIFSNAKLEVCEGLRCGRDAGARNGADASQALNIVAEQVVNFASRRPAGGNPSNPGSQGELIANGSFDQSTRGWSSKYGNASVSSANVTIGGQTETVARVSSRTNFQSGLYQDLGTTLQAGKTYRLTGGFAVTGSGSGDEVRFALEIRENGQTRFQYLENLSLEDGRFTDYSASFRLDATRPTGVGLVIFGPEEGVTMYADNISLKAI